MAQEEHFESLEIVYSTNYLQNGRFARFFDNFLKLLLNCFLKPPRWLVPGFCMHAFGYQHPFWHMLLNSSDHLIRGMNKGEITETKHLVQTTSSVVQLTPVSPLPELTSSATVTLSSRSDISASSPSSVVADLSVIANLLPNTVTLSSRSDISASSASSVAADLSVISNLLPNTESKWSRWSSWSDCTRTCGTGTRYRNRTCVAINDKAVFAPISCAGKSNQVKFCAEWSCPDCSRNCSIGTLNTACDACTCDHHELTGRVLTDDGAPLSEANISLAETPYNILAQANISGHFSVFGVCAIKQQLLVTKSGFVPVKLVANVTTPTTATIIAKMEIAVPPFVTVHPESKIRMPGQRVTFCCYGDGNPPPEVEWFKENNIIDKEMFTYNNTLEISDVTGLNGTFRCRMVNDFGSEFSNPAELNLIENSDDSCSSKPNSKNTTLPSGCVVSGTQSSIVDVGECEPAKCIKRALNVSASCSGPSLCCGPLSYESVSVQCGALMSFNIFKVKTCACGNCKKQQAIVEGIAISEGGRRVPSVDVFFGEQSVGKTDSNGMFSFIVPRSTKRAVVTFKDLVNQRYEEETRIFLLSEGEMATYRVKLRPKPEPISFNASEPLDLPLGGAADNFADLELPENSLLAEDGSVFKGNAKVSLSIADPRNQSDIDSAPGDFSTISEDGDEEILETFGMIKLNLEDDNGKPLSVSKPMNVYLDPGKLNLSLSDGNVSIKLYWLDRKTGRWREAGDFFLKDGDKRRRKRSNRIFLAGTVTPSIAKRNLNFDKPKQRVGLRVTTTKDDETGVIVRVIREDHHGYVEAPIRNGVACIPIWKDTICLVQAEKDNMYYIPDPSADYSHVNSYGIKSFVDNGGISNISSFRFKSSLVKPRGPIYYDDTGGSGTEMNTCRAPLNSAYSIQFTFKPPPLIKKEYQLLSYRSRNEWYYDYGGEDAATCLIKVKIVNGGKLMMMASSYSKMDTNRTGNYGFHLRMSTAVVEKDNEEKISPNVSVVCLQIRCPRRDDPTVLLLTPMNTTMTAQCSDITGLENPLNRITLINSQQKIFDKYCENVQLPQSKGQEKWYCIPDLTVHDILKEFVDPLIADAKCLYGDKKYVKTAAAYPDSPSLEIDCR
ncbi:cartilage intermediate layer protein 1-like [Stylophora pistillata]|uniref:cartilage intermediate layer protein 1-like n=1 Tax=Stylophora pistillata TaxID=50429 RepID=UPI000C054602|nr:cartilage intermediate layer protein 1-like [Stylophora pistillata]